MFNILIAHYNTPALTEAAIRSVYKHVKHFRIHVFDNSDRLPLLFRSPELVYHDNTQGQIIDFDEFLQRFPNKQKDVYNVWGSAKHTYTIDRCFDLIPEGFVLLDSDVLLKKDISELVRNEYPYVGQLTRYSNGNPSRILPMVCYINVPLCRKHGIRYFSSERSWLLTPDTYYDTGASFYEDCTKAGLNGRFIRYRDYAEHLGGGSYRKDRDAESFLQTYKSLYN